MRKLIKGLNNMPEVKCICYLVTVSQMFTPKPGGLKQQFYLLVVLWISKLEWAQMDRSSANLTGIIHVAEWSKVNSLRQLTSTFDSGDGCGPSQMSSAGFLRLLDTVAAFPESKLQCTNVSQDSASITFAITVSSTSITYLKNKIKIQIQVFLLTIFQLFPLSHVTLYFYFFHKYCRKQSQEGKLCMVWQ